VLQAESFIGHFSTINSSGEIRQKGGSIMIILIKHYGLPFVGNKHAVLLATGVIHHIVLVR
jgi:hypothetical protein